MSGESARGDGPDPWIRRRTLDFDLIFNWPQAKRRVAEGIDVPLPVEGQVIRIPSGKTRFFP